MFPNPVWIEKHWMNLLHPRKLPWKLPWKPLLFRLLTKSGSFLNLQWNMNLRFQTPFQSLSKGRVEVLVKGENSLLRDWSLLTINMNKLCCLPCNESPNVDVDVTCTCCASSQSGAQCSTTKHNCREEKKKSKVCNSKCCHCLSKKKTDNVATVDEWYAQIPLLWFITSCRL